MRTPLPSRIYVIGGVPRTGKTTLGVRLANELAISNLETDHFRAMFNADPTSNIGYKAGASIEEVTLALRPYLESLLGAMTVSGGGVIINGEAIQPEMVTESPSADRIQACFLGIGDPESSFNAIRQHANQGDWTQTKTDGELRRILGKYAARSEKIEETCARLSLTYFDVSADFRGTHEAAFASLTGTENIPQIPTPLPDGTITR
jgi:shikimate kinase